MSVSLAALAPEARERYLFVSGDEFSQVDWVISPENMSVVGFAHRALVDNEAGSERSRAWVNLGPRFALGASVAGGLVLVLFTSIWALRRRHELTPGETIAAFVPVVLLAELNAWPHHCIVMLVPLAIIVAVAARQVQLGMVDTLWIAAMIFLYTFCPVHQFDIGLPKTLEHLVGPTTTYAMVLAWLFMLLRYPVLKRRVATIVP